MSFQLAHIHEYNRFLAMDIGSYRVRAGVFSVENPDLKEISYSCTRQNRKNFSYWNILDMRWIAKTIEQTIISASQDLLNIPDDIIISFSSSNFLFDSATTQYIRIDPTSTLTMQELDIMIKNVESASYARAKEKFKSRSWMISDDLRLISSTITSITIDGKKISNPVGFSGWKVVLTVLNVFAPASEFNILRSIVSSLDKKAISLIPTPILFPKIIEKTKYINEKNCYIDIGYSHTTVLIAIDNEIKSFETFSVGSRMLMELIRDVTKNASLLSIENIICSKKEINLEKNRLVLQEFFEYIMDLIWGFLEDEWINMKFSNLFLHWAIFKNPVISKEFSDFFESYSGYSINKKNITELVPLEKKHDEAITYALGLTASELLLVKKDPLIRILRYVLYNYE